MRKFLIQTRNIFFQVIATTAVVLTYSNFAQANSNFEDMMDKVLALHPELRAAEKETEAAELRSEESFLLGDATASVTNADTENAFGGSSGHMEYAFTQGLNWPGKSHNQTKLARIETERSRIELERKRRQIERESALAYGQLLSVLQKDEITKRKLETLNAAKKVTSRNVRSGLAPPIEDRLIQREIELAGLRLHQLSRERFQKVSEIETRLPGAKIKFSPEPTNLPELPRSYFQKRSAQKANILLKSYALDMERSNAEASLRRQSTWPDMSLGLTRKSDRDYSLGIAFTIPLWYPVKQGKQIAAAEALEDASRLRLEYQKEITPSNESLLRSKIQNLTEQLEARRKIEKTLSESTLKEAKAQFERGRIDWKQLQLAVDALFEDQESIVDLDTALFSAQMDIYDLLGAIE